TTLIATVTAPPSPTWRVVRTTGRARSQICHAGPERGSAGRTGRAGGVDIPVSLPDTPPLRRPADRPSGSCFLDRTGCQGLASLYREHIEPSRDNRAT